MLDLTFEDLIKVVKEFESKPPVVTKMFAESITYHWILRNADKIEHSKACGPDKLSGIPFVMDNSIPYMCICCTYSDNSVKLIHLNEKQDA